MNRIYFLVAFIGLTVQQQPPVGCVGCSEQVYPRGAVRREIAKSSPYARDVIERVNPELGSHFHILIRATVYNATDHDLVFTEPVQYYDVYDNKTGERAAHTPSGCYLNFFLDCYVHTGPPGTPGGGLPKVVIPPNGSHSNVIGGYLDQFWDLPPGEYTVVGYYCAAEREGPECFKSNRIMLFVPEPIR